ncbi:MAG: hypothetical protein RLZZ518_1507, partial [Actinomycetota bacterium]
PSAVLAVGGSRLVADTARAHGKELWLVAGVATRLPEVLWNGVLGALNVESDWRSGVDVLDASLFARIIGPTGSSTDAENALAPECATTTELLRRSVI